MAVVEPRQHGTQRLRDAIESEREVAYRPMRCHNGADVKWLQNRDLFDTRQRNLAGKFASVVSCPNAKKLVLITRMLPVVSRRNHWDADSLKTCRHFFSRDESCMRDRRDENGRRITSQDGCARHIPSE